MNPLPNLAVLCAGSLACMALVAADPAEPQARRGPVIEKFGPYVPLGEPDFPTPVTVPMKAVFDVARTQGPGEPNPRLETPARFLNMHADAGVPVERIQLALVVHGPAARDLLTDEAYRKRYGTANPNRALLEALGAAGVQIILCGQTAAFGGYTAEELLPEVKLALSAMTALVSLQDQGFRLIAF